MWCYATYGCIPNFECQEGRWCYATATFASKNHFCVLSSGRLSSPEVTQRRFRRC